MKTNIQPNYTSLGKKYFWLRENLPESNYICETISPGWKEVGWRADKTGDVIVVEYITGYIQAEILQEDGWHNINEYSEEEIQEIIKGLWETCG